MDLQATYTMLVEISRQMLEFAEHQDWESLAAAESRRSALLTNMPAKLPALSPLAKAGIEAAILQIQDCDREILEYVTPWREQVASLLARLATHAK